MNINVSRLLNVWFKLFLKIKNNKIGIERIGTNYGGWSIPENLLNSGFICYFTGAGEDISVDVGIVGKYYCKVYVLDPTPRAYSHYNLFIQNAKNGLQTAINNATDQTYDLLPVN